MVAKLYLSPHLGPEEHRLCYNVVGLVHLEPSEHDHLRRGATELGSLFDVIKSEAKQWVLTGAKGLITLLPAATESSGYGCCAVICGFYFVPTSFHLK